MIQGSVRIRFVELALWLIRLYNLIVIQPPLTLSPPMGETELLPLFLSTVWSQNERVWEH